MMDDARGSWDALADDYDRCHGDEGNDWHRLLVEPAALALLGDIRDRRILDLGCGTGVLARRLLKAGARVVGVDGSEAFLERARQRVGGDEIRWAVVDALDERTIQSLGSFDAVVCTMVLMDLPEISPLFRGARRLLAGGPLIVVTAHPTFNHHVTLWSEAGEDESGQAWNRRGVKVSDYAGSYRQPVLAVPGQQAPQWYFHRPMHELLAPAFAAGFVIDALQELTFPPGSPRRFGPEIPPVLALRLIAANA